MTHLQYQRAFKGTKAVPFRSTHRVHCIPTLPSSVLVYFGFIDPVTAVALHGLARLGLVYNLKVLNGSLCVA